MSPLSSEFLKTIAAWAEIAAVFFTALGALSGVTYVLATRPLKKIEEGEKAQLVLSVAKAQEEAGKANERAGLANERAAANEKEAARLTKVAEDERLARVELQEELAPRRLTKGGQEILGNGLWMFKAERAAIFFHAGDHEGEVFASDLWSALQNKAKWKVFAPAGIIDFAGTGRLEPATVSPTGVIVSCTADMKSTEAAKRLSDLLLSLGYDSRVDSKSLPPDNSPRVVVTVDARPLGLQGEAKIKRDTRAK